MYIGSIFIFCCIFRYFEYYNSINDHLSSNSFCLQNHDSDKQIIYVKCIGPCKKRFFKFGQGVINHLEDNSNNCREEHPSSYFSKLKKEWSSHKKFNRSKTNAKYYELRQKGKTIKKSKPSKVHSSTVQELGYLDQST